MLVNVNEYKAPEFSTILLTTFIIVLSMRTEISKLTCPTRYSLLHDLCPLQISADHAAS